MLYHIVASYLVLGSTVLVLAADPYAITGVRTQSNKVPARRNVNDLQAEAGPQWDLYIQALSAMQKANSSDPLSFFQIGGIHGSPAYEWNNTGRGIGDGWPGYCPHAEAIFLPWHRPYVLLYEQVLVDHARKIASGYKGSSRTKYVQAAESLRVPFWDWADTPQLPNATVPMTMKVNTAQGREDVANPLVGFTFPQDALQGQYGQFQPSPRERITRCPSPNKYPDTANQQLQSSNLKELVYDAFIYSETFEDFSSTSGSGASIEQAHNQVHQSGACGQQFGNLAYAGFDPLFMLHHTNVDRLWALWQASHPDKGLLSQPYRGHSRYSTPNGTIIRNSSPLAPFFRGGGNPHTSESVSSIAELGYTYEGLDDPPEPQNQKREVRKPGSSAEYGQQSYSEIDQQTSTVHAQQSQPGYGGSADYGQQPATVTAPQYTGSAPQPTGYPQQSATEYAPVTSTLPEPPTSTGYEVQPSHEPSDERRRRAVAMVNKLYSSKAHGKQRTVYLAHINYRAEDLERPAVIKVYLCDSYVGNIVALEEPKHGPVSATIPLNDAIEACKRAGIEPGKYGNDISVSITKEGYKDIPLYKVRSMKMDLENLEEIPSKSEVEFPQIRNRHKAPGHLKQYRPKKQNPAPTTMSVQPVASALPVQSVVSVLPVLPVIPVLPVPVEPVVSHAPGDASKGVHKAEGAHTHKESHQAAEAYKHSETHASEEVYN